MPLHHVLQEGAVHGVHQVNDGVLVLGQVKELVVGQGDAFSGGGVVDVGHHQGCALHEDEGAGEKEKDGTNQMCIRDRDFIAEKLSV